jgi:hypothetical protein
VAGGQQRLRPIISTTVSTIGGIVTLTITDELWEGLGVVIIFGIAFATVLTLIVVPVMYSMFEGMRYYIISAFRGPRWKDAPQGVSYYFSRRRYTRLGMILIIAVQALVLAAGMAKLAPFLASLAHMSFQAPSLLKLSIEIIVFGLEMILKLMGLAALFLIPTWVGLIYFMAKRSREGYFVDITPEGILVGTPVDRFFLKKDQISKIKPAPFFPMMPSISIYSGRRRIVMRKLLKSNGGPEKKPLSTWLAAKAPKRAEIRDNMLSLKKSLEDLIGQRSIP